MDPRQPIAKGGIYMQIVLSKITDDPKCLYKHPTDSITLSAEIKADCAIMTPIFDLLYDSTVINGHYNYLAAFGRYYFITDITVLTGGSMRISCREDVLYTYAAQIINCPIISDRSHNAYNVYLPDDKRRFYQYKKHQYVTLGDIGVPNIIVIATVG